MGRTLPTPTLCAITRRDLFTSGDRPPEISLVEAIDAAVRGGVNMVQLRERGLPARELMSLAQELRKVTRGRAMLIVNDRADIALAVDADGVQLSEQSMPVGAARRVCGAGLAIGRSVHDLYGAMDAERDGADFLVAGTIFASRSHPGVRTGGPALVREIAAAVAIPVLAIGGIDPSNAVRVMKAGAAGVAAITTLVAAPDPRAAARTLYEAIQAGPAGRGETDGVR